MARPGICGTSGVFFFLCEPLGPQVQGDGFLRLRGCCGPSFQANMSWPILRGVSEPFCFPPRVPQSLEPGLWISEPKRMLWPSQNWTCLASVELQSISFFQKCPDPPGDYNLDPRAEGTCGPSILAWSSPSVSTHGYKVNQVFLWGPVLLFMDTFLGHLMRHDFQVLHMAGEFSPHNCYNFMAFKIMYIKLRCCLINFT